MPSTIDKLISAPKTALRCGVSRRTLNNWDKQRELGFPGPAIINSRRYYSEAAIEAWLASRLTGLTPEPVAAAPAAIVDPVPSRKNGHSFIDRANASELEAV